MSIEEYIKIYEELQKYKRIVANIDKDYFFEFVDNLLSDYIKQKQINEEHQKINAELIEKIKELEVLEDDIKDKRIVYIDEPEFKANYIPKQKIKDKIEELKEDKENKYYDSFLEERDIEKTIDILQELLQESEYK